MRQGKPVVNSISMKEGEEKFIHEATSRGATAPPWW
jgi:Methionine synthase I, cobalamin-binding domain